MEGRLRRGLDGRGDRAVPADPRARARVARRAERHRRRLRRLAVLRARELAGQAVRRRRRRPRTDRTQCAPRAGRRAVPVRGRPHHGRAACRSSRDEGRTAALARCRHQALRRPESSPVPIPAAHQRHRERALSTRAPQQRMRARCVANHRSRACAVRISRGMAPGLRHSRRVDEAHHAPGLALAPTIDMARRLGAPAGARASRPDARIAVCCADSLGVGGAIGGEQRTSLAAPTRSRCWRCS